MAWPGQYFVNPPYESVAGVFTALIDSGATVKGVGRLAYVPVEPGEDVPLLWLPPSRRPWQGCHAGLRVGTVFATWEAHGSLCGELRVDLSKGPGREALAEIRAGGLSVSASCIRHVRLGVARLVEVTLTPRPADPGAKLLDWSDAAYYARRARDPHREAFLSVAAFVIRAAGGDAAVAAWRERLSPAAERFREEVRIAVVDAVQRALAAR